MAILSLLMCSCIAAANQAIALPVISPVVIVPGDGSNQLEAKLDKPSVKHFYCEKRADWYRLWLSISDLLPGAIDCWADNIRLVVNGTGRATNAPGVQTRVPYWGSTEGFEELDPSVPAHKTAAFYKMVQALVAAGYVKNATLRGAPYDFRYTPDSTSYDSRLAALVEETVNATGKKATLISHSMGGLQTLHFLQRRGADWNRRYIARWVAISAPWIGAAKELRLFASGDAQGLPVNPLSIRAEQRSYETNAWLLPEPTAWRNTTTLVRTGKRVYSAQDYRDFFHDIGYDAGYEVQRRVSRLVDASAPPDGVKVDCLYSTGVPTPESFDYSGLTFDDQPKVANGDGDGTVNEASLRRCAEWAKARPDQVSVSVYSNISHSDMIMDDGVIQEILKLLGDAAAAATL